MRPAIVCPSADLENHQSESRGQLAVDLDWITEQNEIGGGAARGGHTRADRPPLRLRALPLRRKVRGGGGARPSSRRRSSSSSHAAPAAGRTPRRPHTAWPRRRELAVAAAAEEEKASCVVVEEEEEGDGGNGGVDAGGGGVDGGGGGTVDGVDLVSLGFGEQLYGSKLLRPVIEPVRLSVQWFTGSIGLIRFNTC